METRTSSATPLRSPSRFTLLAVAFLAFISLGLPDAVVGVAWPSVRGTFRLPISQLGWLLASAMVGYLIASFMSGHAVRILGVGKLLVSSSVLIVMGLVGYILSPNWPVMVVCGLLAGLGGGAIDAGINAYAARHFSARVVNWLHACYGIGATLGPLIMTFAVTTGWGWRGGYAAIAGILTVLTVCFVLTVKLWQEEPAANPTADGPAEPMPGTFSLLIRPEIWTGILIFFLYTGLESTAGQWAFSLFTESRGLSPATAGVWVGMYWASLTIGRILFGIIAPNIAPGFLVRSALLVAPVAAGLIWLRAGQVTDFLGLALLGFTLAPIFPLMISLTPNRVGKAFSAHAIGYQISGACLGQAALPALAGVLAKRFGLEIVPPYLCITAMSLVLLYFAANRSKAARATLEPQLA